MGEWTEDPLVGSPLARWLRGVASRLPGLSRLLSADDTLSWPQYWSPDRGVLISQLVADMQGPVFGLPSGVLDLRFTTLGWGGGRDDRINELSLEYRGASGRVRIVSHGDGAADGSRHEKESFRQLILVNLKLDPDIDRESIKAKVDQLDRGLMGLAWEAVDVGLARTARTLSADGLDARMTELATLEGSCRIGTRGLSDEEIRLVVGAVQRIDNRPDVLEQMEQEMQRRMEQFRHDR